MIKGFVFNDEKFNTLNRMVSSFIDVAEINALDRHPMIMKDCVNELEKYKKSSC